MPDLFGPLVKPAEPSAEATAAGASLPSGLRLGTSSWSFPGWHQVYAKPARAVDLPKEGLSAYAKYPIFRTVGVDRSWYGPVKKEEWRHYAEQTPADFRFLIKAPAMLTSLRMRRGKDMVPNDRFLDPALWDRFAEASEEGLGDKLGVNLLQFPPQRMDLVGGVGGFLHSLDAFLGEIEWEGTLAVEVRNREILTREYASILKNHGAVHTLVVFPGMPRVDTQLRLLQAIEPPALVARWMLRHDLTYGQAKEQFAPFSNVQAVDEPVREHLVDALEWAIAQGIPAWLIANNKAEGSSPESLLALAQRLLRRIGG